MDGKELFRIPDSSGFEHGGDTFPLPDGTVLSIELVPDFWKHRRMVVSRNGEELKPVVRGER